ncbi:hypothetical protein [Nostoc sp.]|uniref:hypothetical protein n=1 Tax=Nostoc sp. TaxID=1180 RepID=UPI002FFAD992
MLQSHVEVLQSHVGVLEDGFLWLNRTYGEGDRAEEDDKYNSTLLINPVRTQIPTYDPKLVKHTYMVTPLTSRSNEYFQPFILLNRP